MTSTLIIDRIENGFAVVESDTESFSLPMSLLPEGAKEGDSFTMTLSLLDNTNIQKEAQERLDRLKERDSGDDIIDL